MSDQQKPRRDALHTWHVWMNRRQDEQRKANWPHEHSLYEFKSMLDFLEYGHKQIQQAYEGKLRVIHQQCSHSSPETLPENKLKCAIGEDVTTCPILLSLKETFTEQRDRECGKLGKFYGGMTDEDLYRLMARTCAWHMYSKSCGIKEGGWHGIDTSEGYLMDESDRMFWRRTYESMAGSDPDESAKEITDGQ